MALPKFTIKSIHDIAQIHKFTMFIYKVDPGLPMIDPAVII